MVVAGGADSATVPLQTLLPAGSSLQNKGTLKTGQSARVTSLDAYFELSKRTRLTADSDETLYFA